LHRSRHQHAGNQHRAAQARDNECAQNDQCHGDLTLRSRRRFGRVAAPCRWRSSAMAR
jgi:hypothetical protein